MKLTINTLSANSNIKQSIIDKNQLSFKARVKINTSEIGEGLVVPSLDNKSSSPKSNSITAWIGTLLSLIYGYLGLKEIKDPS